MLRHYIRRDLTERYETQRGGVRESERSARESPLLMAPQYNMLKELKTSVASVERLPIDKIASKRSLGITASKRQLMEAVELATSSDQVEPGTGVSQSDNRPINTDVSSQKWLQNASTA